MASLEFFPVEKIEDDPLLRESLPVVWALKLVDVVMNSDLVRYYVVLHLSPDKVRVRLDSGAYAQLKAIPSHSDHFFGCLYPCPLSLVLTQKLPIAPDFPTLHCGF